MVLNYYTRQVKDKKVNLLILYNKINNINISYTTMDIIYKIIINIIIIIIIIKGKINNKLGKNR